MEKAQCPACGNWITLTPESLGRAARCNSCQINLQISPDGCITLRQPPEGLRGSLASSDVLDGTPDQPLPPAARRISRPPVWAAAMLAGIVLGVAGALPWIIRTSGAERELRQARQRAAGGDKTIADLSADLKRVRDGISDAKANAALARGEAGNLRNQLSDAKAKLGKADKELAGLTGRAKEHQDANKALSEKVAELQKRFDSANAKLTDSVSLIAKLQERLGEIAVATAIEKAVAERLARIAAVAGARQHDALARESALARIAKEHAQNSAMLALARADLKDAQRQRVELKSEYGGECTRAKRAHARRAQMLESDYVGELMRSEDIYNSDLSTAEKQFKDEIGAATPPPANATHQQRARYNRWMQQANRRYTQRRQSATGLRNDLRINATRERQRIRARADALFAQTQLGIDARYQPVLNQIDARAMKATLEIRKYTVEDKKLTARLEKAKKEFAEANRKGG